MKFNCEPTVEPKMTWHTWFAWFPVRVGPGDCRWLEKVERRGNIDYDSMGLSYWRYEYRTLP
jgi:hypothetical protein